MRCNDIRWKLNPFLEGSIATAEAEKIRRHLDLCGACVSYLVSSGKIEQLNTDGIRLTTSNFENKVADAIPNRTQRGSLTRYFLSLVVATSFFSIAVFAFLRHYCAQTPLTPSAEESALVKSVESMLPWLKHAAASPLIQLIFFSLVATLISVALIALVDNPRHPLRRSKS